MVTHIISDNCQTGIKMFIKSLELDNFKSFGNKKTIHFEKGFSIISGPNGSGKSNIGDSLLFVLGTRSSKTIRADRLSDLIHKASASQRQKNYCKVTITVDSERDGLPDDLRLTRITRELVKEGEDYKSNYYINENRAKRYEVEEYLQRMQLFLDSYSFVLQGDINNLIKMTGFERRKLLESIAGIESYNNQIDKAKSDIDGILSNLKTLEALKSDLSARVEMLRLQREDAVHFNAVQSRVQNLRATIMQREVGGLENQIDVYSRKIDELKVAEKRLNEQKEQIAELISERTSEIKAIEKEKEEISGDALKEVQAKINQCRIDIAERKMKLSDLGEERDKLISEKEALDQDSGAKKSEISELNSSLASVKSEFEKVGYEISVKKTELSALTKQDEDLAGDFYKIQLELKKSDEIIASLNLEIEGLKGISDELTSKKNSKTNELVNLESRKADLEFEIRDAKWRIKNNSDSVNDKRKQLESLNKRFYDLRKVISERSREKDELSRHINENGREYEKLLSLSSRSHSGLSKASQVINSARSSGDISGIIGTVRDLITFDDNVRSAVEAAAGARLNSFVVTNDEVAEQCLNLLKREKAGKLTFLPLNKMASGRPRGKAILVRNSGESIGYVSESLHYESLYENVIWYCFQDTLLMKDIAVSRKNMGGVRMVTLDGDIFEASGAITGGFTEKRTDGSNIEEKLSKLNSIINEQNSRLIQLTSELNELQDEMHEVGIKVAELSKTEGSNSKEYEALNNTIQVNEQKLIETGEAVKHLQDEINDLDTLLSENGSKISTLKENLSKETERREKIYKRIEKVSPETISRKRELESSIEGLLSTENNLNQKISNLVSEIKMCEIAVRENAKNTLKIEERLDSIGKLVSTLETELTNLSYEMTKFRTMEEQLDARNKEFNTRISEINSEIESMRSRSEGILGEIGSNHDNLITLGTRLDNMVLKLKEAREELGKAQGTPIQTEMSSTEMKNQIVTLEKEIESMGPINLRAIEEYDQENSNLEKMIGEISRLNDERRDLENLMQKLNDQKKIVFNRLFKDINQKMNSIYYILSDGGEAGLEISDENDPLNSEVYIKARPKGTNFSKIEALSGGEKSLTALAFIMAVQRINPSPIYYLDEIDMYLDGANAERIGKMFRENSYTSQILVVTLKSSVLKYADSIIGVTSFDDENSEVFEKGLRSDKEQHELKKDNEHLDDGKGSPGNENGGDDDKD